MSRLSRSAVALFVLGVVLGPSAAQGQKAPPPEKINITTADGVALKANFYPAMLKGALSRGAPTVIMLHPIGEGKSMSAPEWKALAEKLQANNYSVITFDFRGHGDSTSLADKDVFWKKPQNFQLVKLAKGKDRDTIDVKDYKNQGGAYYPILVNDIAAVRSYLDRRNDDTKDCNTSSLIVIGAENAATLGALWINSEWHRYKFTPNPMNPNPKFGTVASKAEGQDIIAAVFLSIQPTLEKRTVSLQSILKTSAKDKGMAALFVTGSKGEKLADTLTSALKKKDSARHEFIGPAKLNTELSGIKLLQKGLKTDDAIVTYLDNVVSDRKEDRTDKEFMSNYFIWQLPNGARTLSRNSKAEKTLNFFDYGAFLP